MAAAVALAAGALVVGVGNSEPPVDAPPLTIDEEPPEVDPPLTEQERREAEFGVELGEGPGLEWQAIDLDIEIKQWTWADGRFIADDGATEWSIALDRDRPTTIEQASVRALYPDYRPQRLDGGRLFAPPMPIPDHLIVIPDGGELIRIDLPDVIEPSTTDLITSTAWFSGAIIEDRLVLAMSAFFTIDIATLGQRTSRDLSSVVYAAVIDNRVELYPIGTGRVPEPIPLADLGVSESEIMALTRLDQTNTHVMSVALDDGEVQPAAFDDLEYVNDLLIDLEGQLLLGWDDGGGLSWVSTTTDGVTWRSERRATTRWLVNSGTQLFDFNTQGALVSRSSDGETWNITNSPLGDSPRTVAGDVVALGRPWDGDASIGGVPVETGDPLLYLVLFNDGRRFELRGPDPFGPVVSGWIDNPWSGARRDPNTNELVFIEPRTGDELLRVAGHDADAATAEFNPLENVALARWPIDVADPEWLVTSPTDLFGPGALDVEFVAGHQQILAVVTTADGYELHLADTEAS